MEWSVLPTIGTSGGIIVAWKPVVIQKEEEMVGNFSVFAIMKDCGKGVKWVLTGVYGTTPTSLRSGFWEELAAIRGLFEGPWVVRGDFNVIRFALEKNSGS